jgi:predicted Zn-dependent protease with MMP-like domain
MNDRMRHYFDEHLAWVVERLPVEVKEKIEEVPLIVEDYPTADVMEELGIEYRDELCGYYRGVSLDDRSLGDAPTVPDYITLYREGIMSIASDGRSKPTDERLREEIRITILHEIAHHHGIDEDELDELGYG